MSIDWDSVLVTKSPRQKEVVISFPGTGGFGAMGSLNPDDTDPGGLPTNPDGTPIIPETPDTGLGGAITPEPVPPSQGGIPECQPQDCSIDTSTVFENGGGVIFRAEQSSGVSGAYTSAGASVVYNLTLNGGQFTTSPNKFGIITNDGSSTDWEVIATGTSPKPYTANLVADLLCGGEAYIWGGRINQSGTSALPKVYSDGAARFGAMSLAEGQALPNAGDPTIVWPRGTTTSYSNTFSISGSVLAYSGRLGTVGTTIQKGLTEYVERRVKVGNDGKVNLNDPSEFITLFPLRLNFTLNAGGVISISVRQNDGSYSDTGITIQEDELYRFDWKIDFTQSIAGKTWTVSSSAVGAINGKTFSVQSSKFFGLGESQVWASEALPHYTTGYGAGTGRIPGFDGIGTLIAVGDVDEGPFNEKMTEIERSFLTYTPPPYCARLP